MKTTFAALLLFQVFFLWAESPDLPAATKKPDPPANNGISLPPETSPPPPKANEVAAPSDNPATEKIVPQNENKIGSEIKQEQIPQVSPPPKSAEPEIDEETKKQIEEAKQKILREKAERELRNKEAAAAQNETNQRPSDLQKHRPQVLAGIFGGPAISLNDVHGGSWAAGATLEGRLFGHYGLRASIETGVWPTRDYSFQSGNDIYSQKKGNSLGSLLAALEAQYVLPLRIPVEIAVGAGVGYYQVRGGTYDLISSLAPQLGISLFYQLLPKFEIGILANSLWARSHALEESTGVHELDKSASLGRISILIAARYRLF